MIALQNISKIYPVAKTEFYALRNVTLSVAVGEFVAVCGASGSGKTTLLNILGCVDNSSVGTYTLDGENVQSLSDRQRARLRNEKIGFVLQDFALISDQTVLFNVMLPLLLGKGPYKTIRDKALKALNQVGLGDQVKKKVNQLSGGQRQRVAIARAIVNEPAVLLADEPTGQLDSQTGIQIMELLKQLNAGGTTVIVVTHDRAVAGYAGRLLTVVDGRVLEG